jgi:cytochrome c oxidase subunit IV
MRVESILFAGATCFLASIGLIYGLSSHERAGTSLLILGAAATLLVAAYLLFQARRRGPRPEDRPDATIEEGAGDVGYFPTSSFWPFGLAAGAVVLANGLVFGVWLVLVGAGIVTVSVIGYTVESQNKA